MCLCLGSCQLSRSFEESSNQTNRSVQSGGQKINVSTFTNTRFHLRNVCINQNKLFSILSIISDTKMTEQSLQVVRSFGIYNRHEG